MVRRFRLGDALRQKTPSDYVGGSPLIGGAVPSDGHLLNACADQSFSNWMSQAHHLIQDPWILRLLQVLVFEFDLIPLAGI